MLREPCRHCRTAPVDWIAALLNLRPVHLVCTGLYWLGIDVVPAALLLLERIEAFQANPAEYLLGFVYGFIYFALQWY